MNLLDSNIVIAIINNSSAQARRRFDRASAAGQVLAISSIVLFELRYGVAKSRRRAFNQSLLQAFIAGPVDGLPFDDDDALSAGALRATLESAGTPIGPYDVLIAAQALRRGATLATSNVREFRRVQGLKVEDWTR